MQKPPPGHMQSACMPLCLEKRHHNWQPASGVPPQQATAGGPTRTGEAANDQQVLVERGRVYKISPTPVHLEYRRAIPVSRQAARDAFLAMECGISASKWVQTGSSSIIPTSSHQQQILWRLFAMLRTVIRLTQRMASRGSSLQRC